MHIRTQTTIYLIRHGQTQSNANKIKQGIRIDDYLDTKGVIQMEDMAKLIKFLNLDVLYTSYLRRAEESAVIIEKGIGEEVPLLHDFRLRERDFGYLSGKSESEIAELVPDREEQERLQTYDYQRFGGEAVDQVRQRVLSAILDILTNNPLKNIGVISHGGPIRLLLFHFPSIPRIYHASLDPKKDIANADIYEWEITDEVIANIKSLLK